MLVVTVVGVATFGRRLAAALAALSAAAWFDFFHTQPHYSFTIRTNDDLITAGLLLLVGLAVGELAVRSRRNRAAAAEGSTDIARIHAIAQLVASGEAPEFVVIAVASELRSILSLRDCRFEPGAAADARPIARIQRDGDVTLNDIRWGVGTMGLPGKNVELLVEGGGHVFGRFLLTPNPGQPIPFDKRLVAVALADQVGSALATSAIKGEPHG